MKRLDSELQWQRVGNIECFELYTLRLVFPTLSFPPASHNIFLCALGCFVRTDRYLLPWCKIISGATLDLLMGTSRFFCVGIWCLLKNFSAHGYNLEVSSSEKFKFTTRAVQSPEVRLHAT